MPREQKEDKELQGAIKIIAVMQPFERNLMAAHFVADRGNRNIDYVSHDIMVVLDIEWGRVYQDNRIKKGFGEAAVLAFQYIFGLIYGENKYKQY